MSTRDQLFSICVTDARLPELEAVVLKSVVGSQVKPSMCAQAVKCWLFGTVAFPFSCSGVVQTRQYTAKAVHVGATVGAPPLIAEGCCALGAQSCRLASRLERPNSPRSCQAQHCHASDTVMPECRCAGLKAQPHAPQLNPRTLTTLSKRQPVSGQEVEVHRCASTWRYRQPGSVSSHCCQVTAKAAATRPVPHSLCRKR